MLCVIACSTEQLGNVYHWPQSVGLLCHRLQKFQDNQRDWRGCELRVGQCMLPMYVAH
jgi:hypothetical protein